LTDTALATSAGPARPTASPHPPPLATTAAQLYPLPLPHSPLFPASRAATICYPAIYKSSVIKLLTTAKLPCLPRFPKAHGGSGSAGSAGVQVQQEVQREKGRPAHCLATRVRRQLETASLKDAGLKAAGLGGLARRHAGRPRTRAGWRGWYRRCSGGPRG